MRPATIARGSPSPSVTATTPAANERPRCAPPHPRTARKATAAPRAEQPPQELHLALSLVGVERGVGATHEVARTVAGAPDRRADGTPRVVRDRRLEPLGDRRQVDGPAVRKQDGELVAADARQQVAAAQLVLPGE